MSRVEILPDGTVQTSGFTSSLSSGENYSLYIDGDSDSFLEVDNIRVRGKLATSHSEYQSLSGSNGDICISNSGYIKSSERRTS